MKQFARFACMLVLTLVAMGLLGAAGSAQGSGETSLHTRLSGAAINHIKPHGYAQYDAQYDSESGVERQLEVEVEHVNLPNGTFLSVNLNGVSVGTLKLSRGHGQLELDTQVGNMVPAINIGDHLTVVTSSGAVVLSGAF